MLLSSTSLLRPNLAYLAGYAAEGEGGHLLFRIKDLFSRSCPARLPLEDIGDSALVIGLQGGGRRGRRGLGRALFGAGGRCHLDKCE